MDIIEEASAKQQQASDILESLGAPAREEPRIEAVPKEKTFRINYTGPDGKNFSGMFTNKILTIKEKIAVGLYMGRLSGQSSIEALDPLTVQLLSMVAHLEYSLVGKPDWFKDPMGLTDNELLVAVYEEVASHEATFRGDQPTPPSNQ